MYRYGLLLLTLVMSIDAPVMAQHVATCEENGTAAVNLQTSNLLTTLYNNGNLFYNGAATYEIPKGSGNHSVFASSIWIGGYADDSLRVSAATYSRFAYRPGPLAEDGSPPEDCKPFDRFWEIRRRDVEFYNASGAALDNLLNWPAALGAPILDGDGNPDNYRVEACDLPAIRGDRAIWWIMNDVAAPRPEIQPTPLGLEVGVLAYVFDDPGVLSNTTFYDYTITYKGKVPLTDTYIGIWADIDLGGAGDDRVGSDTTLQMVYTYNSDNDDTAYGDRPPAIGFVLLDSPTSDDGQPLGMSTALTLYKNIEFEGEAFLSDPVLPHHYSFLRAHSETGRPITFGGPGIGFSEEPTSYMFPADPGDFWSEENIDSEGNGLPYGGDRRMLLSSGPFTMQPGDTQHFHFAIVWAQAPEGTENPRLASVAQLKEDVGFIWDHADSLLKEGIESTCQSQIPDTFSLRGNYPNPFNPTTRIAFDLPEAARVSLSVYDVLGREVMVLPARQMASGAGQTLEINAASLPSGVYLYRLEVAGTSGLQQATGRMVVLK